MTDFVIIKFMTLQLPSILDVSFDKHVVFKLIALVKEKPLKCSGKQRKKPFIF